MQDLLTPGNIVVAVIVVVALIVGGRKVVGGLAGTQSCCGEHEGARRSRHVEVADTDEANYPYATELLVGGMSCEGCVANVENALNALPGVWASVDLAAGTARVRSKEPVDAAALEAAVKGAGYYVQKL